MEIIRDFENVLTHRLSEKLNFMQVVLGPRQVGKTTALKRIVESWAGPKVMVTADAITPPSTDWLATHWRKARSLGENTLFVMDEVQKIPHWSESIKILFDEDRKKRQIKIVLLGSASLSLQKGLSESLAGRYEVIKAHHWNLDECRKAFGFTLEKFLQFGGYPAGAELIHDPERWASFIMTAILEPVLAKDIQGLVAIRKPALFRQAFELAMRYPAQEISLQKLLGQLQDRGNVTTLQHYLELFEGAFLIKVLQKYSARPLTTRGSSPKLFPLNMALVNAFTGPEKLASDSEWKGRVFEAAIGAHLHTSKGNLYYWREGNHEVDYVLSLKDRLFAIEVKSGRKKSAKGMDQFLKKYQSAIPVIFNEQSGERLLSSHDVDEFLLTAQDLR